MARKFIYFVAVMIVLVIAAMLALRLWGNELTRLALVPRSEFSEQQALGANTYADPAMWYARPGLAAADDPSRWQPEGAQAAPDGRAVGFAVFFIHPTSFFDRTRWNAPMDDPATQDQARIFLRGMASPFAGTAQVWAPKYRQATFGAMISDARGATAAVDAAYRDVALAFDQFLASAPADQPIVIAGHSQGALHAMRLLKDKVAGTPLQSRIAAAYVIGWPVSPAHDLPVMGLPACTAAGQGGCITSFASFAEPAEPGLFMDVYRSSPGLDGQPKGADPILCVNPLTGTRNGNARASANLGTLKPDDDLQGGTLIPAAVPARCGDDGLLMIGDPPELGAYVLPGNNYHVYDIPLFWANLQADVARRVGAWTQAR